MALSKFEEKDVMEQVGPMAPYLPGHRLRGTLSSLVLRRSLKHYKTYSFYYKYSNNHRGKLPWHHQTTHSLSGFVPPGQLAASLPDGTEKKANEGMWLGAGCLVGTRAQSNLL